MKNDGMKRIYALIAALAIVLTMGIPAMAEEADETVADAAPSVAAEEVAPEEDSVDIAAAKEAALADYDAAIDAVLDEMVSAGALPQDLVDSYRAQRDAQRYISKMDTSNWTLDQISALRQAVRGKSVNETILAGLISQGAITQAEADMFKLAYAESVDIWGQIDSGKATAAMMTKLKEAHVTYQQALSDAGLFNRQVKEGMASRVKDGLKQGINNNRKIKGN